MEKRKARPERIRVRLWDDTAGTTPLDLPDRRMWPLGLIFAAMFAIFAGIAWTTILGMREHTVRNVFDLVFVLFQGFWVLGWSVGVVILGALTLLFLSIANRRDCRTGSSFTFPGSDP